MKKTKQLRIFSLIAAILLTVTALLTLASCKKQETTAAVEWKTEYNDDHAEYLKLLLLTNADARVAFVAASRGYNMYKDGFDDAAVEIGAEGTDDKVEAAKAALQKVRPENAAYAEKFDEYCDALTEEEIENIVVRMQETVDLDTKNGPLATVLTWIGKFLKVLTKISAGNYIFALFIFAVIVEIVLLPFGIKQRKDSLKQARLRPKEMAIRKKYAGRNDQASQRKMSEEIQRLYQEQGYNPLGGCLPMLIQLPLVLALYQIVIDPLRYVLGKAAGLSTAISTYVGTARAAGGLGISVNSSRGTISLLSNLTTENIEPLKNFKFFTNSAACYDAMGDFSATNLNFRLFGGNMGDIPTITKPSWLWLVPILTFAVYFVSMKVNRKLSYQPVTMDQQQGCSNNVMDISMPLMSVYITFIVPAAVGIYWIFKSLLGMLKQWILHITMPLPVFTEEDYKAAEKELKGKQKPEKRTPGVHTTASGKQVRSLHHIDDDDEELPPPVKEAEEEEKEPAEPTEAPEQTQTVLNAAPLKEDRKNKDKEKKDI